MINGIELLYEDSSTWRTSPVQLNGYKNISRYGSHMGFSILEFNFFLILIFQFTFTQLTFNLVSILINSSECQFINH